MGQYEHIQRMREVRNRINERIEQLHSDPQDLRIEAKTILDVVSKQKGGSWRYFRIFNTRTNVTEFEVHKSLNGMLLRDRFEIHYYDYKFTEEKEKLTKIVSDILILMLNSRYLDHTYLNEV